MNVPSAESLLRIWERNADAHPLRRALAVLDAAAPGIGESSWSRATIGARDAALLDLHERLFGRLLETTTDCPRCTERLESTFATADFGSAPIERASDPLNLSVDSWRIDFRLPNSDDLLEVSAIDDADTARMELLRRCVIDVEQDDEPKQSEHFPAAVAARLAAEMADRDPLADIRMQLHCPSCGHVWTAGFDIVSYFWDELDDWAQRTLADVHTLASAYGWSEHEILELTPTRRSHYIEMVRA